MFNRAYQAYRQPGSAIKPVLVYAPYLIAGHMPDEIIDDSYMPGGPKNVDDTYRGLITLTEALGYSTNVPAWKIMESLTPETAIQYLHAMNYAKINDDEHNMAISVGGFTYGVSPVELAAGYATLENNGTYRNPTCVSRITNSKGENIVNNPGEGYSVYTKDASIMVTKMMEWGVNHGILQKAKLENAIVAAKEAELKNEIASSLLSSLPEAVSEALKEVGELDLYSLVVGSIFYKLAGLLLPIIYMIMAANNLVAGQVDTGSMAYVLSTSTKRKTVVFTQAVYLIGSLFLMFCLTTATGCVCLALVTEDISLTYGQLVLLNVGAFCVLLCLSGLNFLTSCWFDRSKRSMAIGGGLSIFALVAAMLGLFGSPIIPSVVRLASLNAFNYVTVISLFDVISIIDGTNAFIWKFVILAVAGLAGYVIGGMRFDKKDLPL